MLGDCILYSTLCTLHSAQSSFNLYYSNIQMYETFNAKFNGSIKRGYLAPNIEHKQNARSSVKFSINSEMENDCDFRLLDTIIIILLI